MVEEYDSIIMNSAWEVVPRPDNKSVVGSRWIYKVKQVIDGSVEKHKSRFVAKGFSQEDSFARVTRYSSIIFILSLSAQMGWKIHQMDVETTFLNGMIEEEVYIEQPKGFETFNKEFHVCRLKRALYGLKQAPRALYTKIHSYFTRLGFTKSEADVNLYHIVFEDADWVESPSKKKSTSGRIFTVGSTLVSCYNKKHRSVALSSIESEYMATSQVACEAIWMRKISVGLFGQQMDPKVIYCDNQSCIKLFKNLFFHDQSKHINIQYHHLQDYVQRIIMLLDYIPTEE
eukprot:PITA_34050